MNGLADASSPWLQTFWLGCYLSALSCVCFGVNWGRRHGFWPGARQVVLFGCLVGFFFLLESFGEVRIPFYVYSRGFPDSFTPVPLPEGLIPPFSHHPLVEACQHLVQAYKPPTLPLSIPLMEASLTYGAMWTARLLGAPLVVQPILAGLAPLLADTVLDPIVTTSFDVPAVDATPALQSGTLGIWKWYVTHDLGPDLFGIPLINYAIWFGGPLMLTALVNIGRALWGAFNNRPLRSIEDSHASKPPPTILLGLAVVISCAAALVVAVSPALTVWSVWIQRGLFHATVIVSLFYFVRSVDDADRCADLHLGLVLPQVFFLLFPIVYVLATGLFRDQPLLLLNAVFYGSLALLYCWSPYGSEIDRYRRFLAKADGYLRLRYLSYSSLLVLLGAATIADAPSTPMLVGLVLVALGFNTHSFLVNDVIDRQLDRTQPRRQDDPQVRGEIRPEYSIALAVVVIPLLFLITQALGGGLNAHAALSAALVFMGIYNAWGKRSATPPITDLIQGMAWGSLAVYGAQLAGSSTTPLTWLVAAYGTGFMFLVNGVHGGLRDLENDLRHHQRTTAIYFGATPDGKGGAVSTPSLRMFALLAHGALMLVLVLLAVRIGTGKGDLLAWATLPGTVAVGVASVIVNQKVAGERVDRRDLLVTLHLFVVLLPLLLVAIPVLSPLMRVVVVLAFFGSLLFVQPVSLLRTARAGRGAPGPGAPDGGVRAAAHEPYDRGEPAPLGDPAPIG